MMAKRGGSELNHDNWDREDEKEDAGNFQSASADQMKARVIKRARRRNVGDESAPEKKNAFASFGGFAGKSEVQAPSFSFGPKAGSESSDKPSGFSGFGFGLSQSADQKSVFGSQTASFGSSMDAPKAKTPSFGSEAFSFGSKTQPTTAGGGSTFSLTNSNSFGFSGSSSDKAETAPVFGGIKPASPVTPVTTPAADQQSSPAPLMSDFSSFKKPAGWSCDVCMISNPMDKTKCLACEAAKPGSAPETSSFKFGAVGGGGAAAAPASASLFAFGTSKTSEQPPSSGGFLFGSKSSASSQEPAKSVSGFKFGETKPATADKDSEKDKKDLSGPSGFVFGNNSSPKTPSFSFNSSHNSESESKKEKPVKEVLPVTSNHGAKLRDSLGGPTVSAPPSKHSSEYLSHLKALNNQVLAWLKMHIESNPLVILSPVFKDYETHLKDLDKKYGDLPVPDGATDHPKPEKTTVVSKEKEHTVEPTKAFSFGISSGATTTSSSSGSSFSFSSSTSAKFDNPTSSTAPAFSFSVNSTAPAPSFGAFTFGSGASASANTPIAPATAATEAEEDEDQPPVVEVKQVEENDALYSKKCKLFYKKDGQYKEKGVGMLYLKSIDDGKKTQLLVRADTNLGNVLLNILLSSQMPTTRVGKNNVMIVCVPNPPIDPKEDSSEPCPMLLRVKTTEDADELLAKIDELKDK